MKKVLPITSILMVSIVSACTWVKVTPEGRDVEVMTAAEVAGCEQIGSTTSKAVDKIVFVDRNEQKLAYELSALARNEAANMGGNVVVRDGEEKDGRQKFIVYKCASLN